VSPIDITVHDLELALAFAAGGIPLEYLEDHEDGPALGTSLEALDAAAVLLRIVARNPRLGPDLETQIAHLMQEQAR
jgi:hypothetical protein